MHLYVFIRIYPLPFVKKYLGQKIFIVINLIFLFSLIGARYFAHNKTGAFAKYLELVGMIWLGSIFLIFVSVFFIDLLTCYGIFFKKKSKYFRVGSLSLGVVLSIIAIIQGCRPPVFSNYEILIPNLPQEMDGKIIVAISDLHIGSLTGKEWLEQTIYQIQQKKPNFIFLLGDIFEGHSIPDNKQLGSTLKKLSASHGVWAVLGNHFFHGNDEATGLSILQKAGIKTLRNEWIEISPGLVLAGVDDLTRYYRKQKNGDLLYRALKNRPTGATTIFLSHSPMQIEDSAKAGVNLMLSGHTHGGQIWPFDYIVKQRYSFLEGKYQIGNMTLIVCRGTGTWGPRMRLFHPNEILHITLRKGAKRSSTPETIPTQGI